MAEALTAIRAGRRYRGRHSRRGSVEHESAWTDLVRRIRHDLDRGALRIILRTAARLRPGDA